MRATQANRAVIAARAAARPVRTNTALVGSDPSAVAFHGTGQVKRSRALPMTATQRDPTGKRSDWNRSPEFFTDPKWSATCKTNPAV